MHLGLDEGVEVPEAALHEVVRGHLGETHLQKDLAELLSNLEEGVHATAVGGRAGARDEVVALELGVPPAAVL